MSDEDYTASPEERGDIVTEADPTAPDVAAEAEAPAPEPAPASQVERDYRIPKERFDEVNDQLREERRARLEAEARLREATTPKAPAFDAKAAEKAYHAAMADGDTSKAETLFEQIREHDRRGITDHLTAQVRQELAATREQMALEAAAEAMVDKYPFLDASSPEANAKAINEVVEWRDYYVLAKQLSPAQALKHAVARVAPTYAKAAGQSAATQTAADRTQAQRLANAKAAATLPPSTAQVGIGERATRAQRVDVAKMSDAEFAALPDEERAKLRGDVVT